MAATIAILIAWTIIVLIGELYGMPYSSRPKPRLFSFLRSRMINPLWGENMANTVYLKQTVEENVRRVLSDEYGVPFSSKVLRLITGGTHEFDAVSEDGRIVASIKSSSEKTSGGKNPSGKIKDSIAELYFLTLVEAQERYLILTNEEFYNILTSQLRGKVARECRYATSLFPSISKPSLRRCRTLPVAR